MLPVEMMPQRRTCGCGEVAMAGLYRLQMCMYVGKPMTQDMRSFDRAALPGLGHIGLYE